MKRGDTLYFLSNEDKENKILQKHFDRFSKRKNGDVWVYLRKLPTVCVKVYEFNQDALTLPAAVTYAGNFIGTSEKAVLELKEKLKR